MTELRLSPLYVNARRVAGLIGTDVASQAASRVAHLPPGMGFAQSVLTEQLAKWLATQLTPPPTFESLAVSGELAPGMLFTVHRDFYCRGVSKPTPQPIAYAQYDFGDNETNVRLELRLNRDHVVPGSPAGLLSGRAANLFVVAVAHEVSAGEVVAIPTFIGHRIVGAGELPRFEHWGGGELQVEQVDSFANVVHDTRDADHDVLRDIPERAIKQAFAEIVGEPTVPKDWGGEQSDLFTTQVSIDGRRVATAFVFKGPGNGFSQMTLAHLGKNGDQLFRLANEPADFLVVQHVHNVHAGVRLLLRAICNRVGSSRRFCVVDGRATVRILRAYSKCGLT